MEAACAMRNRARSFFIALGGAYLFFKGMPEQLVCFLIFVIFRKGPPISVCWRRRRVLQVSWLCFYFYCALFSLLRALFSDWALMFLSLAYMHVINGRPRQMRKRAFVYLIHLCVVRMREQRRVISRAWLIRDAARAERVWARRPGV
jgi:hypothetical protein